MILFKMLANFIPWQAIIYGYSTTVTEVLLMILDILVTEKRVVDITRYKLRVPFKDRV